MLRSQVEQFRDDALAELTVLVGIEQGNTRAGNDWYHAFLLDLGLRRARQSIEWADDVLRAL